MSVFSYLFALGSVILVSALSNRVQAATGHSFCLEAAKECRFRFHGAELIPTISMSPPSDRAVSPRIISKDSEILGVLNSNNIPAEVLHGSYFRPIDSLPVYPRLTPTHIKPFSILYTPWSGIGFQTLTKSQRSALSGKCIRVFFTQYQILNKYGHVIENVNYAGKYDKKCVVFHAK